MKIKPSPLQLLDFTVFSFKMGITPTDDPREINLSLLPVEIDFDTFQPKDAEKSIRIIEMNLLVNKAGKKAGYKFSLTASGVFSLEDETSLNENEKNNLLGISTINLMISNIRGFLKNVTSYGTFGAYLLPSVDMNDLMQEKVRKEKSD
jgi:preprotein translocase subunit SecB